jgi:hypothetical protein
MKSKKQFFAHFLKAEIFKQYFVGAILAISNLVNILRPE